MLVTILKRLDGGALIAVTGATIPSSITQVRPASCSSMDFVAIV